jgi:arylsulfatase A-like enzyme
MAPNVLLVVLDTARRDVIEPYGAQRGSTPAIAQLAGRGRALSAAYATASWTLPSHASMFTGLLPRHLGVAQAPDGTPHGARNALSSVTERMLPQVLREAGYATQGWSTNLWVSPHAGFDIGFDQFEYVTSGRHDRMHALLAGGRRAQLAWALEGLRSNSDDGAAAVGRGLREAIERWSGRPTFWFVNLSECHSPYLPPRPWNDLGPAERVRGAMDAKRHLNFESICLYIAGVHDVPGEALARMRHLYRGAVSYMDHWLGEVLEALDARQILEETLVIVTSDHGENFGEGGLITHGFSVDERLVHVPLVMAGPGTPADDQVFSLAALPRMVAGAAGIERHPWPGDELPEGVAVAQYDPIGAPDDPRIGAFAEQWGVNEEGVDRLTATFTAVTDGRLKLVERNGSRAVYDLGGDPDQPDRDAERSAGAAALRSALGHPMVSSAEVQPQSATAMPDAPADELEAIERQMKLLGYM